MRRLMLILTGSLLMILTGCTKYEIPKPDCPEDLPTNVSYAADVQPIFDARCVMCHSGGQAPDLSAGWSYDELTGGGYLDTDFPCSSSLYTKLAEGHNAPPDEELLTILGWISEGAENN